MSNPNRQAAELYAERTGGCGDQEGAQHRYVYLFKACLIVDTFNVIVMLDELHRYSNIPWCEFTCRCDSPAV